MILASNPKRQWKRQWGGGSDDTDCEIQKPGKTQHDLEHLSEALRVLERRWTRNEKDLDVVGKPRALMWSRASHASQRMKDECRARNEFVEQRGLSIWIVVINRL